MIILPPSEIIVRAQAAQTSHNSAMEQRPITVIGAACGRGAQKPGCQDGPDVLQSFGFLDRLRAAGIDFRSDDILHVSHDSELAPLPAIADFCTRLAAAVGYSVGAGKFPVVLGGDHSCAIGTWSGVKCALPESDRLGLIWIDAHMDSHTRATSPSNAIHGMPLACLLGHGDERLTHIATPLPKLLPQDVCLIGTRSFEDGEAWLLQRLGVRIFFAEEVARRGMAAVWDEALSIVQKQTAKFGVSLDLDVLDPLEEPGVGSPEPGGMLKEALVGMLGTLKTNPNFAALEIVEYNPYLDTKFVTAEAVCDLLAAIV